MGTLKVVAIIPTYRVITQSLIDDYEVLPCEYPRIYYRGDLRKFAQNKSWIDTAVQTEVSVFSILGRELATESVPSEEVVNPYWQFPIGDFAEGASYVLLLEVPIEDLEISQFGVKTEPGQIQSEQDMRGCDWSVKLRYVKTEYIAEVQVGCVWGKQNKFLYTSTLFGTKEQLHVATGECVKHKIQATSDVLHNSLVANFEYGRPLYAMHRLLVEQSSPSDPQWMKLTRINHVIEGKPLVTPTQETMKTSAFG